MTDDLDTILRDHGGLEGLAREIGQFNPVLIEDHNAANENEPRERVAPWKHFLRAFFTAMALVLVVSPASAKSAVPETVQELYQDCKGGVSSPDYLTCIVYIAGVADVMLFLSKAKDERPDIAPFAICARASYGALVQAFINWAEQNPKEWGASRTYGVMMALKTNWACDAQ